MADSRWTIEGKVFRSAEDYQAGLRDKKKIDSLKAVTDWKSPNSVVALFRKMEQEQYQFETPLGREFDDKIFELAQKYISQGYDGKEPAGGGRKKASGGKKAVQGSKTHTKKNRKNAGTQNGKTKGGNKSGKQMRLEDYDPEMQKSILEELSRQERRRKWIVAACALTAVVCFGYFGVYNYFAAKNQSDFNELAGLKNSTALAGGSTVHKTGEKETPDILDEYKTLYNKNKSLIGWLKIDDTIIDYPVMQSNSSEYYLTHNYNQEYDRNGSIFMDPGCDVLKPSTNLILYGHHMRSGKMFGDLNKYSNEDYAKQHKLIQFDTIYEKGTYQVMYVFRSKIFYEDEITFKYYQFIDAGSEAEFNSAMDAMADMALFDTGVRASYGDCLLTLSTCDNSEEDGRFVVVAKRIL